MKAKFTFLKLLKPLKLKLLQLLAFLRTYLKSDNLQSFRRVSRRSLASLKELLSVFLRPVFLKLDFLKLKLKKFILKLKNFITKNNNIVIVAGGSGGHIMPAMKVAKSLIEKGKTVFFITDKKYRQYSSLFEAKPFIQSSALKIIETPVIQFSSIKGLAYGVLSFFQNLSLILKIRPSAVVGFGSFVSAPTLFASVCTFRKIILHEQNVVFGKANRFFLSFADVVFLSFPDISYLSKRERKIIESKYIISGLPNFLEHITKERVLSGKVIYDVSTKPEIVIVITGGSFGANFFADRIPPAMVLLARSFPFKNFIVYHQVRKDKIESVFKFYAKSGATNLMLNIKPLFENMPYLLSKADFAIIRGGAGSIIETSLSKVFPVIIPISNSKNNHQARNATVLSKNNAGVVLLEKDYTPEKMYLIFSKAINEGLFYFPVVNTGYDLFQVNAEEAFLNVILDENKSLNQKSYD